MFLNYKNKKRKMKNQYHKINFIIVVIFILSWIILLLNFSPDQIIDFVGVKNIYLIAFIVCFLGGVSILIPIPYYLIIFTLGAAGSNPLLLGLIGGTGQMLGDSTSFLLGHTGRHLLPDKLQKKLDKFLRWLVKKPKVFISSILILYASILPLPNDIFTISLGLLHYPYIRTIIPLYIGNIIFNTLIALLGFYGWSLFF